MTRRAIGPFVLLVLLALAIPARAAWIDPYLTHELSAAAPDDWVNAYVVLAEQVDLDATVALARGQGPEERHRIVVERLQDVAQAAQRPLLASLADGVAAGRIARVRPFWITNAVAVTATPDAIQDLAGRADVAAIYWDPPIELIAPVGETVLAPNAAAIENGITVTRAPELWAMGFTGAGRLVCDQDTGAQGGHPAFAPRWRGLDAGVAPSAAWFDPNHPATVFPVAYADHGTHTLGTMVGDDGAGNQIGMAPGAKWIAAATVDIGDIFSDAVAGFQWAADPDGDPSTTDDVPDVVNNSWGLPAWYYGSCRNDFNAAVDGCEAAGVVVVFAAGNEGPDPETLRSPGDRIASTLNTFSIGALNQDGTTAASFSSRGPSACDHATIKPEVAAVGVNVRSSVPTSAYGLMSGTSMATPHVAGAVALLRQAFPNTSPETIKTALYLSAVDLGDVGEDNVFGRGRIDVVAAYDWLDQNLLSCYTDADGDGYGDPAGFVGRYDDACPSGSVANDTDCDDTKAAVHPGATEICNGIDDNCNGQIDEGGNALCDDGVYCNGAETCGGVSGCHAGTAPCADNGLFCDGTESCDEVNKLCLHSGDPCPEDGNVCNGITTCNEAQDRCDTSTPPNCNDGNVCTTDSCDPVTGCGHVNNTVACDDGNVCNGADTCSGGTCSVHGTPLDCNDGNVCTTDSCDPVTGCGHVNNTAACDDGNVCNGADTCSGGTCSVHGTPLDCSDGNVCTTDSCDPVTGCGHVNNTAACDDGNLCNGADTCSGGTCSVHGTPLDCNDGNVCTTDSCVPATGCAHVNNTVACDDGNLCNGADTCSGGTCSVHGTPLDCNDGNVCTDDSCVPATGCAHANNTVACDDGNLCNGADTCSGGTCSVHGTPLDCNDGNVCTDDSCVPATGCAHANNTVACDDGDVCDGTDTCSGGTCSAHANPLNCNDGNVCTDDLCDPVTGCSHVNNTAACDDGLFCNGADTCSGGSCSSHAGDPCGENEECQESTDQCVPISDDDSGDDSGGDDSGGDDVSDDDASGDDATDDDAGQPGQNRNAHVNTGSCGC